MSRILLEHVDHVVEVNEGVTGGDKIHFARDKNSPGDQVPNMAKSFTLTFTSMSQGCGQQRKGKTWLSVQQEDRESISNIFIK